MAVVLTMNYTKKLGLPQYSSHACSLSVQVEIPDICVVGQESAKLYELLQSAVDLEIQNIGFLPDAAYGIGNGNGGNQQHQHHENGDNGSWRCSDKQREFLQKIVAEKHLDKNAIEKQAQEMFGVGVRQLNKLQMSGLIDDLLELHGGGKRNGGNGNGNGGGGGRQPYRRSPYRRAGASE